MRFHLIHKVLVLSGLAALGVFGCRSQSQDPCLKSIGVGNDAGFAKTPGGFVVFSTRQISDDGKRLVEVDRLHRITGSFEFSEEEVENSFKYYVDIITTPNALHLGQLDRVYLDVYVDGAYLKLPVVAEEYEQVNKIFREGKKRSADPELLRWALSAFSQAPHALNAKAGKEKSVRDFLKTSALKELCPDGDERCVGIDSLRVYRFQVMLSDFHLSRIYRDEIKAGIAAEDIQGLGQKVRWSKAFLDRQRELLRVYLSQTSLQRRDFVKNLTEQHPDLMKALSDYRSFQESMLISEKQEAKLNYLAHLTCFKPDSADLAKPLCEDFAEFLPETFPDFLKFSTEIVEKELGLVPNQKEFLANADKTALAGVESYKTVIAAARAAGIEAQLFTNYVSSKDEEGNPDTKGLFFGGLTYASEAPTQVTIKHESFEFAAFSALEELSIFPELDASFAVKAKWRGDDFANFRYCFQMGSHISLAGFPLLGLHGGCDQSGGAVIIPAPYTPNNDPVSIQGSVEPSEDPDPATPDVTAARSGDKKGSFHAEDYHPNRDANVSPQASEASSANFSENYRATGGQQLAGCGQ